MTTAHGPPRADHTPQECHVPSPVFTAAHGHLGRELPDLTWERTVPRPLLEGRGRPLTGRRTHVPSRRPDVRIAVTGSIATDHPAVRPGWFADQLFPDRLAHVPRRPAHGPDHKAPGPGFRPDGRDSHAAGGRS